jgi:polygalacturonase
VQGSLYGAGECGGWFVRGRNHAMMNFMDRRSFLLGPAASAVCAFAQGGSRLSARDFGASGDGSILDTTAIQKAIDACTAQGGGTVTLPAGRYLSGTLLLKNNVTLHLDADAHILGSPDIAHYRNIDAFIDGTGSAMGYCLIGAVDAANVGISGEGTIDGQGKDLLARVNKDRSKRPFLIRFVRSNGVSIGDIHLRAPAAWTVHFSQCRDVTADRVNIQSHAGSNNDGFDIDSCQSVRIANCNVDTGDDAICLKTTSSTPCRDIRVIGCTLKSNCAGVKMGTESLGDFEDIRIADCSIPYAGLAGIKLLSVDGAQLRNVEVSNIAMDAGKVALFIRLGARLRTFRAGDPKREVGTAHHIRVSNLRATAEPTGIMICGVPGHPVEDVTLEDLDLRLIGQGTAGDIAAAVPEQESAYPEIRMFGPKLPAWGLYARHVRGLRAGRLKMALTAPDERPAVRCDDADGLSVLDW